MAFRIYNTGLWHRGNKISTVDGAASPVSSPLAVDTTTIKTLTVPSNAVALVISASVALRVSEDDEMNSYFILPADTPVVLDVANEDYVYVRGDSASGNCYFIFQLI